MNEIKESYCQSDVIDAIHNLNSLHEIRPQNEPYSDQQELDETVTNIASPKNPNMVTGGKTNYDKS